MILAKNLSKWKCVISALGEIPPVSLYLISNGIFALKCCTYTSNSGSLKPIISGANLIVVKYAESGDRKLFLSSYADIY